jgi:hypothetical protein
MIHSFDTGEFYSVSYKWQTFKPIGRGPEARRCHGAGIVGNTMLVFGGISSTSNLLNDVYGLNLQNM